MYEKSTQEDMYKLSRCIEYLRNSFEEGRRGVVVKTTRKDLNVEAYIDAAYGTHIVNGKSQTGCCITVGDARIFYYSGKQSIVAKSSTEAELIGLSDLANQVVHVDRIIKEMGYGKKAPTIFQDNESTITLIKKGKSSSMRSRHINIRYFWLHDLDRHGEVKVEYLPTAQMGPANILTKTLQGCQYRTERFDVTRWDDVIQYNEKYDNAV